MQQPYKIFEYTKNFLVVDNSYAYNSFDMTKLHLSYLPILY